MKIIQEENEYAKIVLDAEDEKQIQAAQNNLRKRLGLPPIKPQENVKMPLKNKLMYILFHIFAVCVVMLLFYLISSRDDSIHKQTIAALNNCEQACKPYDVNICKIIADNKIENIKVDEVICYTKDDGVFVSQHPGK